MTSVVWTTPLRMAVVQPYRQENNVIVQTNLQKIYISDPAAIDQVNSKKQMTAFPPNFIHSLDATHMLLSAIKCSEENITFAAVHDSFWTHPADIERLNAILREAFIELHSVNIMEKLKDEFETRYKGYKYLVTIPTQSKTAQEIRMARKVRAAIAHKKAGLTVVEDLQWEIERDTLMASEDPEERKRGEEMLTPSEILRRAGGASVTEVEESLGPKLGGEDSDLLPDNEKPKKAAKEVDVDLTSLDVFEDEDEAEGEEPDHDAEDEAKLDSIQDNIQGEDDLELNKDAEAGSEEVADVPKKKAGKIPTVPVWMPLDFPALPPRVSNPSELFGDPCANCGVG